MYTTMLREFATVLFFLVLDYNYNDALTVKTCKIPGGDAGTCIPVNKCDPLYELHKKRPKTTEEDAFYRQSVGSCGGGGHKLKVCCPPASQWQNLLVNPVIFPEAPNSVAHVNDVLAPVTPSDDTIKNRIQDPLPAPVTLTRPLTNTSQTDNMVFEWYTNWKKSNLTSLTEICGMDTSSSHRIVGGNATAIDDYPWLVLLEYEPKVFKCGGSLISRSHVLTAAHCLYTKPSQVRLSEYNITSEPTDYVEANGGGIDSINVTIIAVQWIQRHPEHVFGTTNNDIGVIKMKEKAVYGDFIKPICLPGVDYKNRIFTVTTKFTVAGWGSDNQYANTEVKKAVLVPYVPLDACSSQFVRTLSEKMHMCAGGEQGKDSCRGDSGGPLMYEDLSTPSQVQDVSTSSYVIVGIVSSGYEKCGTEGRAGIYTYVYNYVDWINEMMKK